MKYFNVHFIILISLFILGSVIGSFLSNKFYFDILKQVDPYVGASIVRIIVEVIIVAFISSILIIIYDTYLMIENKYFVLSMTYLLLIGLNILLTINSLGELPISVTYWLEKLGSLHLTFLFTITFWFINSYKK